MAWSFPTLRTDAAGYVEGYQWGHRILYGFAQHNWLQPGLTYTRHELSNAGTVVLPYSIVPTPTGARVTDLCSPATPSNADASIMQVLVDKKVSDRFDGCFTSAGISMLEWAELINDHKLRNMANDQKYYIAQKLAAASNASGAHTVEQTSSAYADFLAAETLFWTVTGRSAEFALVSNEYYNTLLKEQVSLNLYGNLHLGETAYVNGLVGEIAGIRIIRTGLPEAILGAPAYFMDAETLHIAVPNSIHQIPIGWNIQGPHASALLAESPSFSQGIQYILDSDAPSGIEYTWLHYYFGAFVIEDFLVTLKAAAATTAPTVAVTNLEVIPGAESLEVAFSPVAGATGYTVVATPASGTAVTVTGTSSPITLTGLTAGTAYSIVVTPTNAAGSGPASATVSGTPLTATP